MTPLSPERLLAARILTQVDRGRRLDVAWEASGGDRSDHRSWLRHLVYGTLRLRGRLDHLIAHFTRGGVESLDPDVLLALRIGAFQLVSMGSVPVYAAVSESVEMAKRASGRGAGGLVNAVLRRIAGLEAPESLFPDPNDDLAGYLVSWGSHPEWLVERWLSRFGDASTRALVESNNREPEVFLHPLHRSPLEALSLLESEGLEAEALSDAPVLRLGREVDPARALAAVPAVIQDPAAAWVSTYIDPPRGALVADLCAAPGGKALVAASRAGRVVAADRSRVRIRRLRNAAARLDLPVATVVADARRPPLRTADVVVLDVPCTGTGTLRRHPDARWRVQPEDIGRLARLQEAILEGAAPLVPRGGLLVYATCTLEDEENVAQLTAFLDRHRDFQVEAGPAPQELLDAEGRLVVLPQDSGFDGAFAARLRRTGGS